MLFNHGPSEDLLTPTISDGGGVVNNLHSLFSSSDLFSPADINFNLSSLESKKLLFHPSIDGMPDDLRDEDFLANLDCFKLEGFDEAEFSMHELTMDELFSQSPHSIDVYAGLCSEESNTDDTESVRSSLPWVGKECTIESNCTEDMAVPASPVPSSMSSSSRSSKRKPKLSTSDRKLRKKGQNKTAAEKYRHKKRLERDDLLERHLELTQQNQKLKSEVENFTMRLEQFKTLFVDVLHIPIPTSKSS